MVDSQNVTLDTADRNRHDPPLAKTSKLLYAIQVTTTSEQGRIGEAAVVAFFVKNGYEVYHPMFGNTTADLVVIKDGVISRVEVKTTKYRVGGSYQVQLRSLRYNSRKTVVNKFDGSKSDLLAVYLLPEDRVELFTSQDLDGRSGLSIKAHDGDVA